MSHPLGLESVPRSRLIAHLHKGLASGCRLSLISATAGFGKTTLVSEWLAAITSGPPSAGREEGVKAAWLSLDEGDHDPTRFLAYLVAALQTIVPKIGERRVGCASIPAATADRIDSDSPAQ